jgi:hypothetical protein
MKRETFISLVLLLCGSVASQAFTLDIESQETGEPGQGPRSIFVPGYGEVAFESALDGALVVDSAYASTNGIETPPPMHETPTEDAAAGKNPGVVEITHRMTPSLSPPLQVALHPVDAVLENPPEGWNAVPEAASATLGLVGTLLLLLRRRLTSTTAASGKP